MPPKGAAPVPGDAALLPDKFEEFRSLSYWDGFFRKARRRRETSGMPPASRLHAPSILR
jgi:hypothetical protein